MNDQSRERLRIQQASMPHGEISKRHTMLSHHRTREAIAAGFLRFIFIEGDKNPADIPSEHWDLASVKDALRAMLHWEGDTGDMEDCDALRRRR